MTHPNSDHQDGMAPAMSDFIDPPEYIRLHKTPVETVPPVVSPEIPDLSDGEKTACLMAAKRLMDAAVTGSRTMLQCAQGYLKDL